MLSEPSIVLSEQSILLVEQNILLDEQFILRSEQSIPLSKWSNATTCKPTLIVSFLVSTKHRQNKGVGPTTVTQQQGRHHEAKDL